jgi:hypothetical protein
MNRNFLADKIDSRGLDTRMETKQVFQQPDTGTAVDGRYPEQDTGGFPIAERYQLSDQNRIIKIGVSGSGKFLSRSLTGLGIQE